VHNPVHMPLLENCYRSCCCYIIVSVCVCVCV